jgi:hypothetical protein
VCVCVCVCWENECSIYQCPTRSAACCRFLQPLGGILLLSFHHSTWSLMGMGFKGPILSPFIISTSCVCVAEHLSFSHFPRLSPCCLVGTVDFAHHLVSVSVLFWAADFAYQFVSQLPSFWRCQPTSMSILVFFLSFQCCRVKCCQL